MLNVVKLRVGWFSPPFMVATSPGNRPIGPANGRAVGPKYSCRIAHADGADGLGWANHRAFGPCKESVISYLSFVTCHWGRGKRPSIHRFALILVFAVTSFAFVQLASGQTLTERLKSEGVAALAVAAREQGDAARGAALFPKQELGCANCHAVGAKNLFGPDLTQQREKPATDEHLVESILNPSKVIREGFESVTISTVDGQVLSGRIIESNTMSIALRTTGGANANEKTDPTGPGRILKIRLDDIDERTTSVKSSMPDNLVDQLSDRKQFLDLTRYLMQLADTPSMATEHPRSRGLSEKLSGLATLDQFQCAACHVTGQPEAFPRRQAPKIEWSVGRVDPAYVARFLTDPQKMKPGTTMPDMLHSLNESERAEAADALTHYWMSLSNESFERQALEAEPAKRGQELFHSIGCVACHSPREGSELPSSIPLGAIEEKYNLIGLAAFLENPHVSRPSGRMPDMLLTHWEATDIAHFLLGGLEIDRPASPASASSFSIDDSKAQQGKQMFVRLQCGRCHTSTRATEKDATEMRRTAIRDDGAGCLTERPPKTAARYELRDEQRRHLQRAVSTSNDPLSRHERIDLTLATFNCVACHERDGLGGVPENRDDYFLTTNPNLGPQGRIPPPLSGVGAKLKSDWMRQVLVSGRSIRPYMRTRMPQFGGDNIGHVIDLFKDSDKLDKHWYAKITDLKELKKTASEMVGSQGLNCVACHTFQHKPGQTMPAVDLTEMAERLEKSWFHHYMSNPQQFHRGTVMPTFWPSGKAMRLDILDGDAELQKEAVWQYLLDGRQARTPRGLVIRPIELKATDETVMLRRSYPGIGKRGIGVGYPAQVNLVFDAEQMQLAMLWRGLFADPGGVWRSQGHGTVRPLSREVIRFAKGPEFDSEAEPWVVDEGRPPKHQFRGYFLDKVRRPTFMYRYDEIDVEDYWEDVHEKQVTPFLRRTLTLTTENPRDGLTFRAASGEKIIPQNDGTYLVDNRLRVRVVSDHQATVKRLESDNRLFVPLELKPGKTKLVLDYRLP